MLSRMKSLYGDAGDFASSRSKSPTEMWQKSNSFATRAHCVPLPTPGPPKNVELEGVSGLIESYQ